MARDRRDGQLPGVPGSDRENASPDHLPGVPGGRRSRAPRAGSRDDLPGVPGGPPPPKTPRARRRARRTISRYAVASARAARAAVTELWGEASAPATPATRPAPDGPGPGAAASQPRAAGAAARELAPRDGRPLKAIAIVTCMDPRVNVLAALGLRAGDANVLRNAGGIVTDDTIRSLAISQRLLGTREVILVHHTDCRLQGLDGAALRSDLQIAAGKPPPFEIGAFEDLDADLRASMRRVRQSRFLQHVDRVRGYVYDVGTHRLREVRAD
jgi:carbonic anhydrase